jgi:preprotein translocase subunit YajC
MSTTALAQAGPGGAPSLLLNLFPLLLIFLIFYLLLIRPQQKKQRDHQAMLENLKVGDDVLTSGGIYGRIVDVKKDVLTVEIAPNTRVRVARSYIAALARQTNDKPKEKEKDRQK